MTDPLTMRAIRRAICCPNGCLAETVARRTSRCGAGDIATQLMADAATRLILDAPPSKAMARAFDMAMTEQAREIQAGKTDFEPTAYRTWRAMCAALKKELGL